MTLSDWLAFAATKIPRSEARQLLESVTGLSREELLAASGQDLKSEDVEEAISLLVRRENGEPLAYIVGKKEFCGREFLVNDNALIPRPETELLTEAVLNAIQPGWTCVDVGTGSGCIAITLAIQTDSLWVATDTSFGALQVAKQNVNRFKAKIQLLQADMLDAFQSRRVDLIVSNPPYVAADDSRVEPDVNKWEPSLALYAGPTGLEAISRLIDQAEKTLKLNGLLAFEFGIGQAADIRLLLKNWQTTINRDLAGIDRYVLAQPLR